MKTRHSLALCLALIAPAAHAITYDAVANFSMASSVNGNWTYGYSGALGTITPFTQKSQFYSTTMPAWVHNANTTALTWYDYYPAVGKYTGGATTADLSTIATGTHWDAPSVDSLFMLPGHQDNASTAKYALVRFTAPTSGNYILDSTFSTLNVLDRPINQNVHILVNGIQQYGGLLGNPGSVHYTGSLALLAGDKVDFSVDANGWLWGDGVALQATLTNPVPEPETYALMLAGLGLVGFIARRRQAT